MPPNISEMIANSIAVCRERGIEPDRVRMSPTTYQKLSLELMDSELAKIRNQKMPRALEWRMDRTIHGLAIEVANDCPRDMIYVDCKPEEPYGGTTAAFVRTGNTDAA